MRGTHLTVGDVLTQLLPAGSRADTKKPSWQRCPLWAPDVFAVCATLADLSGFYTEPGLAFSRNSKERKAKIDRAARAQDEGRKWSEQATVSSRVQKLWSTLVSKSAELVCNGHGNVSPGKRQRLSCLR